MSTLEQARKLEAEGKIGAAIDLLEQAVALGEEDPLFCKEIARMCLTINEVRAFANWCHEAIRLNPHDGEPYLMIGRNLSAAGRWGETVEALEHAIGAGALDPAQTAEAHSLLEVAHANYEQWKHDHPGASNL
ncbi:MAG: hypothetical protein HY820_21415 [Acidobacteria bacterium]|nr:hypothetical protein [Acidobacteriota bacterium]